MYIATKADSDAKHLVHSWFAKKAMTVMQNTRKEAQRSKKEIVQRNFEKGLLPRRI